MKALMCGIAAAGLLLGVPSPARAAEPDLIRASDVDEIVNVAKGFGSATRTTTKSGDPKIEGRLEGLQYSVFFYGCNNGDNCQSIQMYVGFKLNSNKPGMSKVNEWNQKKRYGKAYIDKAGDPVMEMDVPMVKGITRGTLDSAFDSWNSLVAEYAKFIGYK